MNYLMEWVSRLCLPIFCNLSPGDIERVPLAHTYCNLYDYNGRNERVPIYRNRGRRATRCHHEVMTVSAVG